MIKLKFSAIIIVLGIAFTLIGALINNGVLVDTGSFFLPFGFGFLVGSVGSE